MSTGDFLTSAHIINGVVPKADIFDTAVTTDYVNVENYRRVGFLIHTGNATGGTADGVITVKAATSAAAAGATAMAFSYRACASSTTVDTWGALTAAASTGVAMTAGDNYMYWVEVTSAAIAAAVSGGDFVSLTVTEDTNDPIDGSISIFLLDPRYPGAVPQTSIA